MHLHYLVTFKIGVFMKILMMDKQNNKFYLFRIIVNMNRQTCNKLKNK